MLPLAFSGWRSSNSRVFSVNLLMPLGELLNQRRRHALDFKIPSPLILDTIAELPQRAGQLMVIDVLDKLLRHQHVVVLQRLPAGLDSIVRGIEDNAVRMQLRIESPRGVMTEHRRHDVTRGSVRALALLADASGSEGLQLIQCHPDSLFVRLDNARVITHQSGDGHRFGRRKREIVEHTPIGVLMRPAIRADIQARRVLAGRQLVPGLWIKILTKTNEVVLLCATRQPQFLGSFTVPLPQDLLAFA